LDNGQEPRDLAGAVDETFEVFFFIDFLVAVAAFAEVKEKERDKVGDKGGDGVEGGRFETERAGEAGGERHKSNLNSERTSNMEVSTRTGSGSKETPRMVWSSLSSVLVGIIVTPKAATRAFVNVS
jgi:hypothetical protein